MLKLEIQFTTKSASDYRHSEFLAVLLILSMLARSSELWGMGSQALSALHMPFASAKLAELCTFLYAFLELFWALVKPLGTMQSLKITSEMFYSLQNENHAIVF